MNCLAKGCRNVVTRALLKASENILPFRLKWPVVRHNNLILQFDLAERALFAKLHHFQLLQWRCYCCRTSVSFISQGQGPLFFLDSWRCLWAKRTANNVSMAFFLNRCQVFIKKIWCQCLLTFALYHLNDGGFIFFYSSFFGLLSFLDFLASLSQQSKHIGATCRLCEHYVLWLCQGTSLEEEARAPYSFWVLLAASYMKIAWEHYKALTSYSMMFTPKLPK